jgi:aspartyl-tRNA synthetase
MPAVCVVYYHRGEAFISFVGDYVPPAAPHFLWVTEFPLFTRADPDKEFLAHGRWSSTHHPFTAPMWQDIEAMYAGSIDQVCTSSFLHGIRHPSSLFWTFQVRGQHYDLVLNGVEIGGGSVRVHDACMQEYIFSQVLQVWFPVPSPAALVYSNFYS